MQYLTLQQKDKKLLKIITEPMPALIIHKNIPLKLMASIMNRQSSTKMASVIFERLVAIYDGAEPTTEQLLGGHFIQ